jgi:DhnA family fructose-bisphosphate aldolase class Ia
VTPEEAPPGDRLAAPALILAADHRARGIVTVEDYATYTGALARALPYCDGILATAQPLADLRRTDAVGAGQRTYLSINRTGLAGSVFELDDRLVASVDRAAAEGLSGVKHMVRIALDDPATSPALELLGQVLEAAAAAGLEALVEPLVWRAGAMARDADSVVLAAVIAHDMGAPLLKVPVPLAAGRAERVDAVGRVVGSVGVPVLFLGGPRGAAGGDEALLEEAADAMAGGAAGLAIGRTVYQHPDPGAMAAALAGVVHGPG